jgi:hypothetical protein
MNSELLAPILELHHVRDPFGAQRRRGSIASGPGTDSKILELKCLCVGDMNG